MPPKSANFACFNFVCVDQTLVTRVWTRLTKSFFLATLWAPYHRSLHSPLFMVIIWTCVSTLRWHRRPHCRLQFVAHTELVRDRNSVIWCALCKTSKPEISWEFFVLINCLNLCPKIRRAWPRFVYQPLLLPFGGEPLSKISLFRRNLAARNKSGDLVIWLLAGHISDE